MTFIEVVPKYIEYRKRVFKVRDNLTVAKRGGRLNFDDMLFAEDPATIEIAKEYKSVIEQYAQKLECGYTPTQEEAVCQVALCAWLDKEQKLK